MSYEEIELSAHNIIDTVVARIAHNWEGRCDCLGNEKSSAWNFMTFTPNFNPKTQYDNTRGSQILIKGDNFGHNITHIHKIVMWN